MNAVPSMINLCYNEPLDCVPFLIDEVKIENPLLFSGCSHIGYCREFIWKYCGPNELASFVIRNLVCEHDVESLLLQQDLYLQCGNSEGYLVKDFHLTDVGDIDNITGEARELIPIDEPFPAIRTPASSGVSMVSQETQVKTLKVVASLISQVKTNRAIQGKDMNQVVGDLIGDIIKTPEALLNLLASRSFDDYTFSHNINVATISLMLGRAMGLGLQQLQSLGVGALLHDIGKLRIALAIMNKKEKLSSSELIEVRRHPTIGYCLLSNSKDIDDNAKNIVLQHHEQLVGSGYPKGAKGPQIPLMAKIVAIADVFDAMTTDRPHRPAKSPYEAINFLLRGTNSHFDPEILQLFLQRVSLYPPGTTVLLSNGQTAMVVGANPKNLVRPIIKITRTAGGAQVIESPEIDLSRQSQPFILKIL